jgi:hypothetical protein
MNKDQNGKVKVEKVGMRQETRDGFEYEITISLDIINDKHLAKAGKDRTGLFMNKPEFVISEDTGKQILAWCESGVTPESLKKLDDLKKVIIASPLVGDKLIEFIRKVKTNLDEKYSHAVDYKECVTWLNEKIKELEGESK